ncbi:hypothetical protein [Dysgonomonas sp. ZJ709]|uniref:hypothetical protein n=1 Tax=Dysgonomonas sp. ZJ709 TaxID=2709797 RepID=UPI0013EBD042|nr:hypothetical protein [Dysgonomonas sp. ZJ709]
MKKFIISGVMAIALIASANVMAQDVHKKTVSEKAKTEVKSEGKAGKAEAKKDAQAVKTDAKKVEKATKDKLK